MLLTAYRRSAELGSWQVYHAPGSAQRSTPVVHITAALSVDLALLAQALDRPDADLLATLHQLDADARLAVPSYLGLDLILGEETPFALTALEEHVGPGAICSSLQMPLLADAVVQMAAGSTLILYAGRAGAFVDLVADLSWLTGLDLSDYHLDQHLSTTVHPSSEPTVLATSVINQAIGVLIGRGHSADEAHERLTAHADDHETDRYDAALHILTTLKGGD